jgi:uncharacterized protein YyaL (SSP411 family)
MATLLFVPRQDPAPVFALAPHVETQWRESHAPRAFVCRNYRCLPAAKSAQQLREQLQLPVE